MQALGRIIFTIAMVCLAIDLAYAKTDFAKNGATQSLLIYRALSGEIEEKFIPSGKNPSNWRDFNLIRNLDDSLSDSGKINQARIINRLALIPGTPTIENIRVSPTIDPPFRLVAVSRNWNFDYSTEETSPSDGGRYIVYITANGESSIAQWIKEDLALAIINKRDGIDLEKLPLAFPALAQDEKNINEAWGKARRGGHEIINEPVKIEGLAIKDGHKTERAFNSKSAFHWVIGILATLILIVVSKKMTRNKE